ncbi:MAG: SDR family oxidoreductase [Candidatus Dormibacteraeota bacterium]|nr:SDR family oxidoreductase [Candidatus Dormibacteraeota bacterium]MBV9525350.1 SDR family oxidoreductase [Candidatus Dormibacteraeota bacterium]
MQVDPLFGLEDRVAIVTGATSGLGERFARVLHERGVRVVVAVRREERLASLVRELGTRSLAVPTDVTSEAAVAGMVRTAVDHFGRLDIMVNNAGASDGGPAETQDLRSFEDLLRVNLGAVFVGCREAAHVMLQQQSGSIINIASVAGVVSLSERHRMAGYTTSKTGVVGLTRELGTQWAARGVRVNAIAPGWFPSEMTGGLRNPDHVQWIEERTPMHRPARVHELDGALLFLASDASSYMVGQVIVVDGGWTAW